MKTRTPLASAVLAIFVSLSTGSALAQNEFDFGDAPDPYFPTLLANNGARHRVFQNIFLGASIDSEPDGQPHVNATGDDTDIVYPPPSDDEDGVSWDTPLTPGQVAQITVTASVNGLLDAWIDFSGNNDWTTVGDQIFTSQTLVAGPNVLTFNVPNWGNTGYTYARFRFNASGLALQHVGAAPDGEVEDYFILIEQEQMDEFDWGDAPQPYPTLAANNGAVHQIVPGTPYFDDGTQTDQPDAEPDGQPSANADGDDLGAPTPDDEDGIVFGQPLIPGQNSSVTITVDDGQGGMGANQAWVDAWIDFNGNGSWLDAGEHIQSGILVQGSTTVPFTVPASAVLGATFARFRIHSGQGALPPTGYAADGEIEDHEAFIDEEEEPEVSHKMHYPQWPDPTGWDVRACNIDWLDPLQKVLADDFLCTSNGPITKITFWGSYQWNAHGSGEFGGITNFHLSIHKDIPALPPELPFSKPGGRLWMRNINPNSPLPGWTVTVTPEDPSDQGWYDPNHEQWDFDDHQEYYRYEITIPPDDAFVQEEGTIYWLDISVKLFQSEGGWGWKTSTEHWNDAAVWADLPVTNAAQWDPLFEPPDFAEPIDLAFIIDGGEPDPEDGLDWGDAPDPLVGTGPGNYQTLASDNGAVHMIVQGAPYFDDGSQTDQPDGEPDGQPHPNAMGDDMNGAKPDDEDGIFFPTPLIVGMGGSVDITVDDGGSGAGGAYVDAWIDFNGDGIWSGAEKIYGNWMPQGLNTVAVNVPAGATLGQTFARFRINSQAAGLLPVGVWPTGSMPDGEVEDHEIFIDEEPQDDAKWLQPPDLSSNGFDVACRMTGDPSILLADDFNCTQTGPITNIIVWGSWLGDELPEGNPSNVMFTLSFHADRPAGTARPWSIPGSNLWVRSFGPGQFSAKPITFDGMQEGWYDPSSDTYTPNADWTCWEYTFPIDMVDAFVQTGTVDRPIIYWLDVQAHSFLDPNAHFGWKTTRPDYRWNDDAAWTPHTEYYDGLDWRDMHYPPGHLYHQWEYNSFDLAFALFGGQEEEDELDWGDAPDQPYPTMAASFGANHLIVPGIFMGQLIDAEPDGQQSPAADGDDLAGPASDDEDGVVFNTPLFPGYPAQIDVTVSQTGWLDVYLDADNNGDWFGPNDLVFSGPVNPGLNSPSINIPLGTPPGQNFMRFRYNTNGPLPPTGGAADGEVEDYEVDIEDEPVLDWGDAYDLSFIPRYPTLSANNGANHIIHGGPGIALRLGLLVDDEMDGQPTAADDGDDLNGFAPDDEDGVVLTTPIIPGTWAKVDVTVGVGIPAGGYAWLQGWADFNNDQDWLDANEQIFTDQLVSFGATGSGVNSLQFMVPTNALPGQLHTRFRLSTSKGIGITGLAHDGEVEDHLFQTELPVDIDWGDAFESFWRPPNLILVYPTTITLNGAHHVIDPAYYLGAQVDPEPDGQPLHSADGDDLDAFYPSLGDDEDGVIFTTVPQRGGYAGVDVTASTNGLLDAWIDFNSDWDWDDANERIFNSEPLVPGLNSLLYPVPLSAWTNGPVYTRFRFSSTGVATYTGMAMDGEVEDHLLWEVLAVDSGSDFGDAGYVPETVLPNGAQHVITAGVMLGSTIDAEPDGQPSAADLDDMTGLDDEDGVTIAPLVAGANATVTVVAGVSGGVLDAWLDFNGDLVWAEPGERLFGGPVTLSPGANNLAFTVPGPPAPLIGPVFARFRISPAGGLPPDNTGVLVVPAGEVEDYRVIFLQPAPTNSIVITNQTFNTSYTVTTNEWTVENGITYQMESSTNLVTGPWMSAGGTVVGPANWQTDNMSAETTKFYRVIAPWTP